MTDPLPSTEQALLAENAELRERFAEQTEMLRAIRTGEVDALVVETPSGPSVYTLQGVDAESNRFRGEVLAQVGDAVLALDHDQRVTYLNAAAERLYGVAASEALGRHRSAVFERRWLQPGGEPAAMATLCERGSWRDESIHILRDGRELYCESNLTLLRDRSGAAVGMLAVTRDVTEKQRVHELLDTLLRTAPIGFCFLDRELRYVRINDRLAAINGLPARAHLGRHVSEIVPTLLATIQEVTRQILETGEAVRDREFSGETQAEPGITRHWNETWYPVRQGSDQIVGFGVMVEEITARKEAEDALRTSQERLRAIYDGTTNYMGLLLPDGTLCDINRALLEFAGIGREDAVGLPFWKTPWFRDTPGAQEAIRDAIIRAGGGETVRFESAIVARWGESRVFELSFQPIRGRHGEIVFIVPTGLDVTERKVMEQALRDADRRKDEFLATLAHELRNPLAPVRSALEVLRLKGPQMPELEWARDVIDRQVLQMTRLIDDLLDVSRISRGKIELRRERIELAKVIWGAVETSRPLIESRGHDLIVHLPTESVMLDADLTRLAQVFLNLLNNAAKYTEPRGRIWLCAELRGDEVVVSVKDTGVGIPAANLPSIFEMFSQVETALSRSGGGLGIGLSLAKRLVEMHGGRIEAHSAGPGRGSEFLVHLSIAKGDTHGAMNGRDPEELRQVSSPLRILVVDDNRDAAQSLAKLLEMVGNTVRTVHDGEAALKAADEFRPRVVLLDIGLPKLNGYDVASRLRAEPWGAEMTLIAVTGWGQESDARRSEEAGFDRHLVKPVDPKALLDLLATLSRE